MPTRSLFLAFCLALWASPAQCLPLSVILRADSTGLEIGAPADARDRGLNAARLDSVERSIDTLVDNLDPAMQAAVWQMTATGDVELIVDLDDTWPAHIRMFTTVETATSTCPRTFIHGSWLLDPDLSPCAKVAILSGEVVHISDFVAGRVPAFIGQQSAAATFEEARAQFENEYRGFRQIVASLKSGGCLSDEPNGRAYLKGGTIAVRRRLLRLLGLAEQFPDPRWKSILAVWSPP